MFVEARPNAGMTSSLLEVMTSSKEEVIPALGRASTNIRKKLGESLSTLQRFDVPLENVTTSSLDALRAYSLGSQSLILKNDSSGALRFFRSEERRVGK